MALRKEKNKGKEKGGERREKKCWKEEEERPLLLFSPFYVTLKYAKMNFLLLIRSINMPCMYNILIIEILIFFQEAALRRLFQDNLTFACKPISLMYILFFLYIYLLYITFSFDQIMHISFHICMLLYIIFTSKHVGNIIFNWM